MAKRTSAETKGGETKGGERTSAETQGWRNTRVAKHTSDETTGGETKGGETQMVPNFFINYQMPKVFLAVGRTRWIAIAIFPDTSSTKVVSKKWFGNLTY